MKEALDDVRGELAKAQKRARLAICWAHVALQRQAILAQCRHEEALERELYETPFRQPLWPPTFD